MTTHGTETRRLSFRGIAWSQADAASPVGDCQAQPVDAAERLACYGNGKLFWLDGKLVCSACYGAEEARMLDALRTPGILAV